MPDRAMQTEDPRALASKVSQLDETAALRQIAGAVSALAGRMDRLDERMAGALRPRVTRADRESALERARAFVSGPAGQPALTPETVHAELAVARYLTGE